MAKWGAASGMFYNCAGGVLLSEIHMRGKASLANTKVNDVPPSPRFKKALSRLLVKLFILYPAL